MGEKICGYVVVLHYSPGYTKKCIVSIISHVRPNSSTLKFFLCCPPAPDPEGTGELPISSWLGGQV